MHRCLDAEVKNDWGKCLKHSRVCFEIQMKQPVSDIARISSSSFYLLSLSKNKKYDEALKLFEKIPRAFTEGYKRGIERQQFRIFSGMADVWRSKNKLVTAIAFQELAVVALTDVYDKTNAKVQDEAYKLRNLLVENKEWSTIRNLEIRYNLKPLPKNEMGK